MSRILVNDIIRHACQITLTPIQDIKGRSRFQQHVRVRHACALVAFENGHGYSAMGRVFNRDHTTMIAAVRQAQNMEPRDPFLAELLASLRAWVAGRLKAAVIVAEKATNLAGDSSHPDLPQITADQDAGQRDETKRHRGSIKLARAIAAARELE